MAGKSPLIASDEQRAGLLALAGSHDRGEADRARAVLLTLAGWTTSKIAEAFGAREDTVRLWRSDFAAGGVVVLKTSVAYRPRLGQVRGGLACAGARAGQDGRDAGVARSRHASTHRPYHPDRAQQRFHRPSGASRLSPWTAVRRQAKLMVPVEDNGSIHTGKRSLAALAARAHCLTVERMPKYAPELDDIEPVWRDLKAHHLAHQTFTDIARSTKPSITP
jgi:DDE superfamily endonuclease/Homeodomain-like domain